MSGESFSSEEITQKHHAMMNEGEEEKKISFLGSIIEKWKFDGNKEAQAWAFASVSMGATQAGGMIMALPLLRLAENAAGCRNLADGYECENKVYGFKPSSLLTIMQTVVGVVIAVLLPIIGGIVDRSKHRRTLTIGTSIASIIYNFVSMLINEENWFYFAVLMTIFSVCYFVNTTLFYAYIPEITDDEEKLTEYNAQFLMIRSLSMLPYIVIVGFCVFLITGLEDTDSIEFGESYSKI